MSGPGERQHPTGSLTAVLRVLLVALAVGAMVLLATLAASTGPSDVFSGSGPRPDRVSAPTPTPSPDAAPDPGEGGDSAELPTDDSGSLRVIGTIVRALLVVLVVVALVAAVVFYLRRRRSRWVASGLEVADDADFDVVDPVEAVTSALADDADEQDAALRTGTPRNGIVEAWLRFELQAARAGTPRLAWETSTEFTVRLLASVRADDQATARLAELYRVARFSDHEVGEADRAAAAAALERIRLSSQREGAR